MWGSCESFHLLRCSRDQPSVYHSRYPQSLRLPSNAVLLSGSTFYKRHASYCPCNDLYTLCVCVYCTSLVTHSHHRAAFEDHENISVYLQAFASACLLPGEGLASQVVSLLRYRCGKPRQAGRTLFSTCYEGPLTYAAPHHCIPIQVGIW